MNGDPPDHAIGWKVKNVPRETFSGYHGVMP
jgi:hypothetical protein